MKREKAHGDDYFLPPDETSPSDPTLVEKKDSDYVQARRGPLDYPYDANEYYSKQSYDFLDELRSTLPATGVNTEINFGRNIKVIWLTCPTGSASSLFVNFGGGDAANAAGSIQIVAGETRQFFISVQRIKVSSDGVGIAGFRITWGY